MNNCNRTVNQVPRLIELQPQALCPKQRAFPWFALFIPLMVLPRVTVAADAQPMAESNVFVASAVGARLDSNLITGGGTDDTATLQRILDRASNGRPVKLIIDGPALVHGLDVYSNTIIECTDGGGLYLKDGSNRALIRNYHRSRDAIIDERITLRGGFFNGNRQNQQGAHVTGLPANDQRVVDARNKEPDGTYIAGVEFMGVNDLTIEHLTIWGARAFGALVTNGKRITLREVTIDDGGGPDAGIDRYANTDALHFAGPLQYVMVDGAFIHVGDDALAFNADDYYTDDPNRNDFGPFVRSGPITDVTVSNLHLMDTRNGVRLLSGKQRIDRILISNVVGSVTGFHALDIGHWSVPASGNVGSVCINNLTVSVPSPSPVMQQFWQQASAWRQMRDEIDFVSPYIAVNCHVAVLTLHNVVADVATRRAILRLGPDAVVGSLNFDVHLVEHGQHLVPVMLNQGARIDRLHLSVDRDGDEADPVIVNKGGRISHLIGVVNDGSDSRPYRP